MIQLTKLGLTGSIDVAKFDHEFETSHVFRLPGLLDADLIEFLSAKLDSCGWIIHDHGSIAREVVPNTGVLTRVLNFAANTPEFLRMISSITRCHHITWFDGRVYRMAPATDHFDSWHADIGTADQDRLVGMSVNLGSRSYEGGVFRLRDESSGRVLCELPNTRQGDAILFRISSELKHMVTPVEGTEPKTAFAGWFCSGAGEYYHRLRQPAQVL